MLLLWLYNNITLTRTPYCTKQHKCLSGKNFSSTKPKFLHKCETGWRAWRPTDTVLKALPYTYTAVLILNGKTSVT